VYVRHCEAAFADFVARRDPEPSAQLVDLVAAAKFEAVDRCLESVTALRSDGNGE
jgi:hypothetical protein